MFRKVIVIVFAFALFIPATPSFAKLEKPQVEPFLGNWALTLPGGGAGWLGVTFENGYLDASVLWGGGSVVPVANVLVNDDTLMIVRTNMIDRRDQSGKVVRRHQNFQVITAQVQGDGMVLGTFSTKGDQSGVTETQRFSGKRIPPIPAVPDLSTIKFAEPINLFNGENLNGWTLTNPKAKNGWFVKDGTLNNNPVQPAGQHYNYGNLRTEQEFEDFKLDIDVKVWPGGNSGIYLRGIYEVQVADTHGRPLDSHHMGGLYSRIAPTQNAEKPANEWQHFSITLCDRHLTVILNGKTIIDNQPVLGVTGGALTSDEFKPGPIYLQGDHTGVTYRNIILTPIIK
jgi:hypothetical protein